MEALTPGSKIDTIARLVIIIFFFIWNLTYGIPIETHYPLALVKLYIHPIWKLLLVAFTVAAITWCPRAGMMIALAVFFYFMDMQHFTKPLFSR